MRSGKKEDSQKRWRQSLWHLYKHSRGCGDAEGKRGRSDWSDFDSSTKEEGGSGGGIQMHETPVQALISFSLPLPHPHSPGRACSQAICRSKNALRGKYRHRTLDAFLLAKGKEREGFIKPNWCGRVLRLSILYYYKTYKKILIVCFFLLLLLFFVFLYGLMPACRLGMHAFQEKNKRHKPGLGHVL